MHDYFTAFRREWALWTGLLARSLMYDIADVFTGTCYLISRCFLATKCKTPKSGLSHCTAARSTARRQAFHAQKNAMERALLVISLNKQQIIVFMLISFLPIILEFPAHPVQLRAHFHRLALTGNGNAHGAEVEASGEANG